MSMSAPTTRMSRGINMLKADVGSGHAAIALFAAARLVWSSRPKGASGTSIKSRPAFAMIAAFSIGPHQPSFMATSSFDGVDSPDLYHARAPSQRVSAARRLRSNDHFVQPIKTREFLICFAHFSQIERSPANCLDEIICTYFIVIKSMTSLASSLSLCELFGIEFCALFGIMTSSLEERHGRTRIVAGIGSQDGARAFSNYSAPLGAR